MSAGRVPADPPAKNIWCDAKDHAHPRKYLEQNIFSKRGVQVEPKASGTKPQAQPFMRCPWQGTQHPSRSTRTTSSRDHTLSLAAPGPTCLCAAARRAAV